MWSHCELRNIACQVETEKQRDREREREKKREREDEPSICFSHERISSDC